MADALADVLEELTGLDAIAGYTALPASGGTCEAVIDYGDPADLVDSEQAAAIVYYEDRSPVVIAHPHAIREGSSEVLRGVPLDGGALIIGCSDSGVQASITLADSGSSVLAQRDKAAADDAARPPGWLASLERMIGSASKAVVVLAVVGALFYLGGKAGLVTKAAKAARKAAA